MSRECELAGGQAECRVCRAALSHTFVDLGMSPLCESFLDAGQLDRTEPCYPLHVYVCERCFLVRLEEYVVPEEIFSEYSCVHRAEPRSGSGAPTREPSSRRSCSSAAGSA